MYITFQLEAQLRTLTGRNTIPCEVPDDATLAKAIHFLADLLGDPARGHLLNGSGEIRSSLILVVNGASVYSEEAETFPLPEHAEILLMPPIGGG